MALEPLFCKNQLSRFLDQNKNALENEILNYGPNYILNISEEDLCEHLVSKYSLEPPKLLENEKYADREEIDVDVSKDPIKFIRDRRRPFYVKGLQIIIAIPFEGDGNLFQYQPSSFGLNPPRAEISGQQLRLVYTTAEHDAGAVEKEYQNAIERINGYLKSVRENVERYNEQLGPLARQLIPRRKEKLLADQQLVRELGIPIKQRDDLPRTCTVPTVRKKPKIARPVATTEPFEPEPVLDYVEYENILQIIGSMALVMERNPTTFAILEEEQIRNHFLMHLNGHYEGQATGETFNFHGKTDILIRADDKNIFIAECKIWKGEKGLLETIDQLLGYTSWRDTKTAILVFSRNQDFSSVLSKIDLIVKTHDCYKKEHTLNASKLNNETTFSYIFHQPSDKNRELVLTVMAFNVPT